MVLLLRRLPHIAYRIDKIQTELYDGASAATLTLTGTAPTVSYRLKISLSGVDTTGDVTINGTETLNFSGTNPQLTKTTLDANTLPAVTTTNLSCSILIQCIDKTGSPIYTEVETPIKIRYEIETRMVNVNNVYLPQRVSYAVTKDTVAKEGSVIRYNNNDFIVKNDEELPLLNGRELYRILYF